MMMTIATTAIISPVLAEVLAAVTAVCAWAVAVVAAAFSFAASLDAQAFATVVPTDWAVLSAQDVKSVHSDELAITPPRNTCYTTR